MNEEDDEEEEKEEKEKKENVPLGSWDVFYGKNERLKEGLEERAVLLKTRNSEFEKKICFSFCA